MVDESKSGKLNIDLVCALFFYSVAAYILLTARTFPNIGWGQGGSPAFYPEIIGGLLIVFSSFIALKSRKNPLYVSLPPRATLLLLFYAMVCAFLMPLVLLPLLGFRVAAALFMFLMMVFQKKPEKEIKQWIRLLVEAVVVSYLIYASFSYIARVQLPVGSLTGW